MYTTLPHASLRDVVSAAHKTPVLIDTEQLTKACSKGTCVQTGERAPMLLSRMCCLTLPRAVKVGFSAWQLSCARKSPGLNVIVRNAHDVKQLIHNI